MPSRSRTRSPSATSSRTWLKVTAGRPARQAWLVVVVALASSRRSGRRQRGHRRAIRRVRRPCSFHGRRSSPLQRRRAAEPSPRRARRLRRLTDRGAAAGVFGGAGRARLRAPAVPLVRGTDAPAADAAEARSGAARLRRQDRPCSRSLRSGGRRAAPRNAANARTAMPAATITSSAASAIRCVRPSTTVVVFSGGARRRRSRGDGRSNWRGDGRPRRWRADERPESPTKCASASACDAAPSCPYRAEVLAESVSRASASRRAPAASPPRSTRRGILRRSEIDRTETWPARGRRSPCTMPGRSGRNVTIGVGGSEICICTIEIAVSALNGR